MKTWNPQSFLLCKLWSVELNYSLIYENMTILISILWLLSMLKMHPFLKNQWLVMNNHGLWFIGGSLLCDFAGIEHLLFMLMSRCSAQSKSLIIWEMKCDVRSGRNRSSPVTITNCLRGDCKSCDREMACLCVILSCGSHSRFPLSSSRSQTKTKTSVSQCLILPPTFHLDAVKKSHQEFLVLV